MEVNGYSSIHVITAQRFMNYCTSKFGWSDLSRDVIMDVGCGEEGNAGKVLLEKFPDVGVIIAIDNNANAVRNCKQNTPSKIECEVADIEKRDTLKDYEGRMTKVISNYAFHQVTEKEEAFRNVFHLLKPGGEAAVLFIMKSLLFEWFTEMLKKPKWEEAYKSLYEKDLYKIGIRADHYREMVEKIGFQVIDCSEQEIVIPYPSDQVCKDSLYDMCGINFNIPPELVEEFKKDSFEVFLKLSARDEEGKPCYRTVELSLLLVKPTENLTSKTEEP